MFLCLFISATLTSTFTRFFSRATRQSRRPRRRRQGQPARRAPRVPHRAPSCLRFLQKCRPMRISPTQDAQVSSRRSRKPARWTRTSHCRISTRSPLQRSWRPRSSLASCRVSSWSPRTHTRRSLRNPSSKTQTSKQASWTARTWQPASVARTAFTAKTRHFYRNSSS